MGAGPVAPATDGSPLDLVRWIVRDGNEEGWLCEEGEREGWDVNGRGAWGQRGSIAHREGCDMNGRGQWGQRGGIDPP